MAGCVALIAGNILAITGVLSYTELVPNAMPSWMMYPGFVIILAGMLILYMYMREESIYLGECGDSDEPVCLNFTGVRDDIPEDGPESIDLRNGDRVMFQEGRENDV